MTGSFQGIDEPMRSSANDQRPVLFIHSSSDLYGSDRSLLRTVKIVDPGRRPVHVVLPYHGPLVAALREVHATVIVRDLGVMRRASFTLTGVAGYLFRSLTGIIFLLRFFRRNHITLVHSNTTAIMAGGIAALVARIPHIWHVREIILQPRIVRHWIAWLLARCSTRVVAVSASVREHLCADRPELGSRTLVIHNGIDVDAFAGGDRQAVRARLGIGRHDVLIGMLGRRGSWKGEELFLDVACKVTTKAGNAYFFTAGDPFRGKEEREVSFQALVENAGLGRKFIVEGFRTDVRDVLAGLDMFVLTSRLPDPFPTTVLEAMAASLPVVANAHGGVREMIQDGVNGYLVTPNEAGEMSERLLTLIRDEALRRSMGESARRRVSTEFGFENYRRRIVDLYNDVCITNSAS